MFGAQGGLQTFADDIPGVFLPLVAKAAQEQNIGRWPQVSLKPSTGDILGSWEFQEGKTELSRHLGASLLVQRKELHILFKTARATAA